MGGGGDWRSGGFSWLVTRTGWLSTASAVRHGLKAPRRSEVERTASDDRQHVCTRVFMLVSAGSTQSTVITAWCVLNASSCQHVIIIFDSHSSSSATNHCNDCTPLARWFNCQRWSCSSQYSMYGDLVAELDVIGHTAYFIP